MSYFREKKGIYMYCQTCNLRFYISPYLIDKRKYCSRKCTSISQSLELKTCPQCEKIFKPYKKGSKYCSKKCVYESRKKRVHLLCSNCKKETWAWKHALKKHNNFFCSKDCQDNHRKVPWIPSDDKKERRRWTHQKRKWDKEIKKADPKNMNLIKHAINLKIQYLNLKLKKEALNERSKRICNSSDARQQDIGERNDFIIKNT